VRQYTLALYQELPEACWVPAAFPYMAIVNPPLWELAHIAWFAEFFCLRWRPDDLRGNRTACMLDGGDELFSSANVPHPDRWTNPYPPRDRILSYMAHSLEAVVSALQVSAVEHRYFFQLSLAHEAMHAEALLMTLNSLALSPPACAPQRDLLACQRETIAFDGGSISLGRSARAFQFDNELPYAEVDLGAFEIDLQVVSEAEFASFARSPAYYDDHFWSHTGSEWRRQATPARWGEQADRAAIHVSYFEAEAWCRWAGRRLPTEVEWEFSAINTSAFGRSAGHVWEWTSTPFGGYAGFAPGPYCDYSAPWFGNHIVLRGGSFATHPLLRYPQFRNFYMPHRRDMFCGFRSCVAA
jgi:ergothioneine biosynthesis protein EgtB